MDTAKPLLISVTRYNQPVLFGTGEQEDGMHLSLAEASRISSKGLHLGGALSGSIRVQNVSHSASARIDGPVALIASQVGAQVFNFLSFITHSRKSIISLGTFWGRGVGVT